MGEATKLIDLGDESVLISIHASRGGSDVGAAIDNWVAFDFNPRFPWGKRPADTGAELSGADISIHASRGGSDVG